MKTITRPFFALVASTLLLLPACQSKKLLDQNVEALRIASEANNYASFSEIAHPKLVEKFPKAQLARLSRALKTLGAFKERTMRGINVKMGGRREGNYTLSYEKGDLDLKIAVQGGKIVSFNFSGEALSRAMKAAQAARYAKFEVGRFSFFDRPGGKAKSNNIFKVGQPVAFKLHIHGLKIEKNALFFVADLRVTAGDKTVFTSPNFTHNDRPLASKGLPVGTVKGTIRLPRVPGTYIAHFKITDRLAKRSLSYEQAIVIQP